jgi:cytochrome P450
VPELPVPEPEPGAPPLVALQSHASKVPLAMQLCTPRAPFPHVQLSATPAIPHVAFPDASLPSLLLHAAIANPTHPTTHANRPHISLPPEGLPGSPWRAPGGSFARQRKSLLQVRAWVHDLAHTAGMPTPPRIPLPTPVQTFFWIRRPVDVLERARARLGPTFVLSLPPFRLVLFSEPDAIRTIFSAKSDEMHAGGVNRILRVLVGDSSVLVLDGPEHMRHRKLLMPSFHGERMRLYGETMADITRRVMETWPDGQPFSLHPHTQEITLEVILRTVFGAEQGAELGELSERMKRLLAVGENRATMLFAMYLSEHPEVESRAPWRWGLRRRNETDATLYRQIAARRNDPRSSERNDVLAMLLQARDEEGQGLTDRELRDELMTALAAGHETTATGLAWAFERILSHPQVYDRLREEVRAAGPDPERIAALPYLDATVKEVLRLRPVVPLVGRVLQKPCTIGGYDLEAGSSVAACIYLAQRNPDVYPEPAVFRPERFLGVQPDPASYLPFGGGIRRCVGAAFALYEMKIVLGTILGACDLKLEQPAPARVIRRAITFWPEGGTRVSVQRRLARVASAA